jgi:hypothetical protein
LAAFVFATAARVTPSSKCCTIVRPMRVQRQATYGALLTVSLAIAGVPQARAQSSLGGSWRAGATAIDVTIESWGTDCGPQPQSTRSTGGGLVNVEQKDHVLLVHGRDQDIRSDACWSRNPAMKRSVASYSEGTWTTRCRTTDNDPRAEQGTYTLKLVQPDTLLYQDVSHYDWALNTSKCVATFTTTQTLTRSGTKTATPARPPPQRVEPPPDVPAPPADEERACTPGAPAHLTLRPKRVDVEVGQRVCFRARVTDAADCAIRNAEIEWSLTHSKALRGTLNGSCFIAADTVAEAQGDFRILAKTEGVQAEAVVSVRPIDLSAVIAKRMEGSGLTGFDESAQPAKGAPKAVARISTHTSTETQANGTGRLLIVGLGSAAAILAALGWWFSRRGRPAAISGGRPSLTSSSVITESSAGLGETVEASASGFEIGASAAPAALDQASEPWICPVCRVGYPAHQGTCPKDGTALMPYSQFAQRGRGHDQDRAKHCPICGKTFATSASFCSNDGASLVDT